MHQPTHCHTDSHPSFWLIVCATSCVIVGQLLDFICGNGFFAHAHHPPAVWQAVAALISLFTYVIGCTIFVFAVNQWCDLPRQLFTPLHRSPHSS